MRRIAIVAPLLVAAVLGGCGSSSSGAGTSTLTSTKPTAGGGAVSLTETEFKISPPTPVIAGTGQVTITVRNAGKITHALAVQTPAGIVRTGNIAPGASATLTVNIPKAGNWVFFCPIDHHRELGMVGALAVGVSGAPASTTVSTTSSSTSTSSAPLAGY
jgi:plastocyanin